MTEVAIPTFKPYLAEESGATVGDIYKLVNEAVFYGHCQEESTVHINPLSEYRKLMAKLVELGIRTMPFSEANFEEGPPKDQVTCLIRHDLDIDIVAALEMARIEEEFGVRSSWYILHTAPYYGAYEGGVFRRNGCMRHIYRKIQDLGHEIALHSDGLMVYREWGRDGAEAIITELGWMRASGLDVCGTTAHNSRQVYGAENFAIFKGRPERSGGEPGKCPGQVEKDGKWALLQQIDEREHGLTYEANEVFWHGHTPVRYGATRDLDQWRWARSLSGDAGPAVGGDDGMVSSAEIYENLGQVRDGEWIVLVIHPV